MTNGVSHHRLTVLACPVVFGHREPSSIRTSAARVIRMKSPASEASIEAGTAQQEPQADAQRQPVQGRQTLGSRAEVAQALLNAVERPHGHEGGVHRGLVSSGMDGACPEAGGSRERDGEGVREDVAADRRRGQEHRRCEASPHESSVELSQGIRPDAGASAHRLPRPAADEAGSAGR